MTEKCCNPFCRTHGMNGDKSYQDGPDAPYNMFRTAEITDAVTGAGKTPFVFTTGLEEVLKTIGETASTSLPAPDDTDDIFPVEIVGQNSNGDDIVRDQTGKLYILLEL